MVRPYITCTLLHRVVLNFHQICLKGIQIVQVWYLVAYWLQNDMRGKEGGKKGGESFFSIVILWNRLQATNIWGSFDCTWDFRYPCMHITSEESIGPGWEKYSQRYIQSLLIARFPSLISGIRWRNSLMAAISRNLCLSSIIFRFFRRW